MNRIFVPRVAGQAETSRLTVIEQGYLFRISRAVPLVLAGLAGAILVAAAATFLYSLVPPRGIREPAPAVIPPDVTVSLQDVQTHLAPRNTGTTEDTTSVPSASAQRPVVDSSWIALAQRVHAIRGLFPAAQYAWADEYQSYCADGWMGYCFQTASRRVREGIGTHVLAAVSLFDIGDEETWINLPDARYQLNVTNAPRKTRALAELEGVLRAVPVTQRRDILEGWLAVRAARENERLAAIGRENQRISSERSADQARYAAATLRRASLRSASVTGFLSAVGALWMLGLTLALLAIERNTRQGRQVAARGAVPPAPAGQEITENAVQPY